MRLTVIFAFFLAFIAVQPITAMAQAGRDTTAASAFVDKVAAKGFAIIKQTRSSALTEEQARIDFREILNDAFDVPTIARFTLGRYWRVATSAQQAEYTRLLRTGILDKYADRVLSYSGNAYKITSSQVINDRDYAVSTTIDRGDQPSVDFIWRLRKFNGAFKVIDISVEGISMSVTHRSDFASVIERNGGRVEALLDALRSKEITKGR